jgi:AmmeMemoRadiSam system protein B/AmmeMemoRadiSam system protein A
MMHMNHRLKTIYLMCIPIVILILQGSAGCRQNRTDNIRPAAVAGQFYPGDPQSLSNVIDKALARSAGIQAEGEVIGLWVPHAGYIFSGQVAASAYQAVRGAHFDAVMIIAPSHHVYFQGASIGDWQAYQTPLGAVSVDTGLVDDIRKSVKQIQCFPEAHRQEHAVEVQIPFIQKVLPGTPIIPVVLGQIDYQSCRSMANTITRVMQDRKILFIASSDMSHYPDYQDACQVDGEMIKSITSFDPLRVAVTDEKIMSRGIPGLSCTLCGRQALMLVMMISKLAGADRVQSMPYMNSGDVSGEHQRVVGYGAALFVKSNQTNQKVGEMKVDEIPLSLQEKKQLIRIARESIKAALKHEKQPQFEAESEHLNLKRGAFVTLTNAGRLRGCIGRFDASLPLYEVVSYMAGAAATEDSRFAYNPVTLNEMNQIKIKISILSPLQKIESIDEIEVGKHGIWITYEGRGGTYLPEVATEQGWSREELLSHCCRDKAGLPPDAWKRADIFIYSSQIVDESDIQ